MKKTNSGAETDVFTHVSAVEFKFAARKERRLPDNSESIYPDFFFCENEKGVGKNCNFAAVKIF